MHLAHETLERHLAGWRKLGHFSLLEEFVLRNGRPFLSAPYPGKRMTAKECFKNAFLLHERQPQLLYVEGFAIRQNFVLPIHHAWLADPIAHTVIDPTWSEPETGSYYGVPFARDVVVEHVLKNKVYGILSPGEMANTDLMFARDPGLRELFEAQCPPKPNAKPSARSRQSSSRSTRTNSSL